MSPVTPEYLGDICVVTLNGEIDAYTTPALRLDLRRLSEDTAVATLLIDLSSVTFLDSSALGAIVGALRLLRERGAGLRIVQPRTAAGRIFVQTGLDAVLELHSTREQALSAGSA